MDIYEDSRLISLNSADAVKLNGDYNSNVFWNIPNIIPPDKDIDHITVSVEDFEMPISYYLINDTNDTLHYNYNSVDTFITLTQGNYNGSTLITELKIKFLEKGLTATIVLSSVTGRLDFRFSAPITNITFLYNLSKPLMDILGFNQTVSGVSFIAPLPLNLLGILKINICSQNLRTANNFASSTSMSNNIIQTIAQNMPSFHQLTYINKTSHAGRMATNHLDNVDLQLYDDKGNFLELNAIDWSITLQLKVFRKFRTKPSSEIDMTKFHSPPLDKKQPLKKVEPKEEEKDEDEGTGDPELDLLLS
jgi:hypothetical protein